MPLQRIAPHALHSRPLPVSQVKKGRQERRMLKPIRVASAWQENIAARVRPRPENRWRASRAQPWLASLLRFLILSEHIKSVASLPEAPGRLGPPVFTPPVFSDKGNDTESAAANHTGKARAPDLPPASTLRQAAPAGSAAHAAAQRPASGSNTVEQMPPGGASFDFPGNITRIARHVRQAPTPGRHVGRALRRRLVRSVPSEAGASVASTAHPPDATPKTQQRRPAVGAAIRNRLERLAPSLLPDYLTAQGYAGLAVQSGCAQNPALLTALHRHLKPARTFTGDPASLARLDPDARAQLMRHLAEEQGFYGARDGEQSAPEFERRLLIQLVAPLALECAPANGTRTAAPDWPALRAHETMAGNKAMEIRRLQDTGLSADAAQWAVDLLWADIEPAILRADTPGDLRYGYNSLDWADLQTGIDIASTLGLDHWLMSYAELVALAQGADMAVRQDPQATGLLALQIRTALLFAGMPLEPEVPHSREDIEWAMIFLHEARTSRWEALQQRQEALEALRAPLPMRSQLADQILLEHGILPDQIFSTPPLLGTPPVGGHVESITDTARNLYLDGRRNLNNGDLPDVNKLFSLAFDQYKTKIRQAIELFYEEALTDLPEEDRIFWTVGEAQILAPQVLNEYFVGSNSHLVDSGLEAKPLSAVVAITHEGQTRHYLAALENGEGRLIRYLAGDLPHQPEDIHPDGAGILDKTLLPHIDDLFEEPDKVSQGARRHWRLATRGVSGDAIETVAKYFVEAIEKQREQAYQATPNQEALQRIRDGLLSLIPFYSCATEVQAGNVGGAVLWCTLDVVGLIPLAGTSIRTGIAAGKLSIRVSASALMQLSYASPTGLLSRQTLRTVIAEMARAAPPAMALLRSSGRTLMRDAASVLDPGFLLAGSIGKGVWRGGQALIKRLRQWSDLENLADRIGTVLERQPFHSNAQAGVWQVNADAVVRHDGGGFVQIGAHQLEVVDLGSDALRVPVAWVADRPDGRFRLVEPLHGMPYGPQWAPTVDGLAALPDYQVHLAGPVPPPDDQGIVYFALRAYIRLGDEYYPVREDVQRQNWRIIRDNDPENAPIPVRYDPIRGQWEVHGAMAQRPSLGDLPGEIQNRIAGHLTDEDLINLSLTDRHWSDALAPELRAVQLTEEARSVTRLAQMRELLGREGIAGIGSLRMSLRGRPLMQLTQRLGDLPGIERLTAFHYLYEAAVALPWSHRGRPLAALADRLGDLPANQRPREYRRIFEASTSDQEMLPHRAEPLVALAGQIGQLGDDLPVRWNAFNALLQETAVLDARRRARPLAALAAAIPQLQLSVRLDRFDFLLDQAGRLPMAHRAGPLAALCGQIGALPDTDRQSAFDRALAQVRGRVAQRGAEPIVALNAEHCALPLTALAAAIVHLPVFARLNRLKLVATETGRLALTQRAGPLAALSGQIGTLPDASRQSAFDSILAQAQEGAGAVSASDAEHRAQLLSALATAIAHLPLSARLDRFNGILERSRGRPAQREMEEIPGLDTAHRAGPLTALSAQIGVLPESNRQPAFSHVLGGIDTLDAQQRAEPLEVLAGQVPTLPGEGWLPPFLSIVRAAVWLDSNGHGAPFMRIAASCEELQPERRLAAVRHILTEAGPLGPERRSELYSQFAGHIFQLPAHQRLDGFDALFDATIALPARHRARLLTELADNLLWMPDERQTTDFNRILGQLDSLPTEDRDLLLEALTAQVRRLPPGNRPAAFERLVIAADPLAEGVQGEPLLRLARIVGQLPEDRQAEAFDRLIDATVQLDDAVRGEQLMRLARLGHRLPADRLAALRSLLGAVGTLGAEQSGAQYLQFARLIDQLPRHRRRTLFDDILAAAIALPAPYRGDPLQALVAEIHILPGSLRLGALRSIAHEMGALSPQRWDAALTTLIWQFEFQPTRQIDMFETLIHASALATTPETRAALLSLLTNRVSSVPQPGNRARAWHGILHESGRLAPSLRPATYRALANRISSIPSDQDRVDAFKRLLDAIEKLPSQNYAVALDALEKNLSVLPAAEQTAISERIRRARGLAAAAPPEPSRPRTPVR